MRAAAARIEGATFESILTRAVFESPLLYTVDLVPCTLADYLYRHCKDVECYLALCDL